MADLRKIVQSRVPKWQRKELAKKDAEEFLKLKDKPLKRAGYFLKWAVKLLVPDFLVGYPNLWDNLKMLRKHPYFRPLRMALAAWLIFTLTFGSLLVHFQPTRAATETTTWPFTTAGDYTVSDAGLIEVAGGVARLKPLTGGAQEKNYPFTTPADYTYDSNKINVTGGVTTLNGIPVLPYAHWHLNESSGITATDSSGNGRNGTTVNSPTWVAGKLNNSLNFVSTSSQYVNCENIAGFERTDPFSIECWLKTAATSFRGIIGKSLVGSPFTGWSVYTYNSLLDFSLVNSASNAITVNAVGAVMNDNVWHHIIITYDGSSNANGVKFYIDGSLKTNLVQTNTLSATIINTENCNIGKFRAYYWNGDLDEVIIYI